MVELQSIFMSKSKNLSLLLSDNHLTEHVAGTEEILKADLVRIPPENEFLHIFEVHQGLSDQRCHLQIRKSAIRPITKESLTALAGRCKPCDLLDPFAQVTMISCVHDSGSNAEGTKPVG